MIVYEREQDFVMIRQHDHAELSSQIAKAWLPELFECPERREDVELAIAEHDRAWIDLDETPLWNDRKGAPFSFIDFPAKIRLIFYSKGIDEVSASNVYAGLLCSMHYEHLCGFSKQDELVFFCQAERARQAQMVNQLAPIAPESLKFHFDLLQFCDDLSLFICLMEPGTPTEQIRWYRSGFPQRFAFLQNEKITARWADTESIVLSPLPLKERTVCTVALKAVSKADTSRLGIHESYIQAPFTERKVQFV
ncbi:DUF3891 family protein [Ferviditalea candida]|uniref:DUF3891 family protein n=1 Tax=Ferviditalea candida TaxID=3108399 RepID=A0ABU5ZES5_9BACL|nr:DUF3891 family protein [Paenibacillaceae bacterium T2]